GRAATPSPRKYPLMKFLEYQVKERFRAAGIPVPDGRLARTPDEAALAAGALGPIAVKAQVPVGGRGKAGGIKLAKTAADAKRVAGEILGMTIKGYIVREVWCETAQEITRELYLGLTLDRDARKPVLILSAQGGMEIEEVAETHPEAIAKLHPDPWRGPLPFEVRDLIFRAGLGPLQAQLTPLMVKLYALARTYDAVTIEINPLALTQDGGLVAADGKLEIDENSMFRHKDLHGADESDEDPLEAEARRRKLTYVRLDGSIGVIGNGAGLVMNTLDLVQREGGRAANFLDVGGGAKAEVVHSALELLAEDPHVKGILINIFGGITRGDEVAHGIIDASRDLNLKLPLVVRMTGTREEEGRQLLREAGITPEATATGAARKIVELARAAG
ncbi:MAG TPA: ADP-forming succinate--CoA ligase subunit beta, partial [Candidatus Dormibacteraeota bacterium]|nr:ADP-forming succinate--CoA ligase subunit beta [Candidatus Dormibacteraeota bacterium]